MKLADLEKLTDKVKHWQVAQEEMKLGAGDQKKPPSNVVHVFKVFFKVYPQSVLERYGFTTESNTTFFCMSVGVQAEAADPSPTTGAAAGLSRFISASEIGQEDRPNTSLLESPRYWLYRQTAPC